MVVATGKQTEVRRVEWANGNYVVLHDYGSLGFSGECLRENMLLSILYFTEQRALRWFHMSYLECRLIGHSPERDTAYPNRNVPKLVGG